MEEFKSPKLERLKIASYKTIARTEPADKTFTVMFNPATFAIRHENAFRKWHANIARAREAQYMHPRSSLVTLQLVLDGTGFSVDAQPSGKPKPVSKMIDEFLEICFWKESETHEPRYLKILWGDASLKDFPCRLESVDITYILLDQSGIALRATLDTVFIEDMQATKAAAIDRESSPDVSHVRVVKSSDTLPLLCREIYGSERYYMRVAQFNNLDHFRQLTPGQTLIFPPLGGTEN